MLDEAGITPRQGPVDTSFERASHAFKNGGFAAAIPNLEDTLEALPQSRPGAPAAEAQQNVAAGTPGAAHARRGQLGGHRDRGRAPWTLLLAAVAAVLVLAAVALIVLRRRRKAPSPGSAPWQGPVAGAAQAGDGQAGAGQVESEPAWAAQARHSQVQRSQAPGRHTRLPGPGDGDRTARRPRSPEGGSPAPGRCPSSKVAGRVGGRAGRVTSGTARRGRGS